MKRQDKEAQNKEAQETHVELFVVFLWLKYDKRCKDVLQNVAKDLQRLYSSCWLSMSPWQESKSIHEMFAVHLKNIYMTFPYKSCEYENGPSRRIRIELLCQTLVLVTGCLP